eukprot:8652693-Pyramimonas_sp.AAC.1
MISGGSPGLSERARDSLGFPLDSSGVLRMLQDSSGIFGFCRDESESERPRWESRRSSQDPKGRLKGSGALLEGKMTNAKGYRRNPLTTVGRM